MVGEKERNNRTVNVRTRDNKVHGEFTLDALLDKFKELTDLRILKSEEYGWSPAEEKVIKNICYKNILTKKISQIKMNKTDIKNLLGGGEGKECHAYVRLDVMEPSGKRNLQSFNVFS